MFVKIVVAAAILNNKNVFFHSEEEQAVFCQLCLWLLLKKVINSHTKNGCRILISVEHTTGASMSSLTRKLE